MTLIYKFEKKIAENSETLVLIVSVPGHSYMQQLVSNGLATDRGMNKRRKCFVLHFAFTVYIIFIIKGYIKYFRNNC